MFRKTVFCILLIWFSFANAEDIAPIKLKVSSSARLRAADGDRICSLGKGSKVKPLGLSKDGELVKVEVDAKHCASKIGYVDIHTLRQDVTQVGEIETVLPDEGLALRSSAEVNNINFKCSLQKETVLNILHEEKRGKSGLMTKVELQNPIEGCPAQGWVSDAYLKPNMDLSNLKQQAPKAIVKTESATPSDCISCKSSATGASEAAKQIQILSDTVSDKLKEFKEHALADIRSPFLEGISEMQKAKRCPKNFAYACSRGLIRMPVVGDSAGFCGSNHYLPDPKGNDSFAAPHTACALVAFAQEWKKSNCPDGSGCRLQWGDISHKTRARFNGHQSHTDGECIDLRPMNTGEFNNLGRTYRSKDYSRDKTKEMILLAQKLGATNIYFNDPKIRKDPAMNTDYVSGHDNHVHLCFRKNDKVKQTCDNLKVSPILCPELQ